MSMTIGPDMNKHAQKKPSNEFGEVCFLMFVVLLSIMLLYFVIANITIKNEYAKE